MRALIILVVMNLTWINGSAQKIYSTPVYLGLDIVKGIPSYILPDQYFIRKTVIIEPYVRFNTQKTRRSMLIGAGFASGNSKTDTALQISNQKFQGVYFKVGFEKKNRTRPMSIGIGPILSIAGFKGNYHFKGATFGDYNATFYDKKNIAFGAEGYMTYDLPLNKKFSLRFLARSVIAMRTRGTISPDYYPGIGHTRYMQKFLVSGGFTTQLFFRCK
ncbi:hypothetical protein [Dyadobacter sp. LHD-138]|uniref:hypothetical protein n=1 Tax=Dyadobacter sp. LHD-138 TaxID=3071413 RepID=UPI0027E149E5|nr:hypothetical protein [Dyadobacter sp. LHD-138]MDQ6477604.1 hypothetical protein [Dyadobacter sp. LHD-138]